MYKDGPANFFSNAKLCAFVHAQTHNVLNLHKKNFSILFSSVLYVGQFFSNSKTQFIAVLYAQKWSDNFVSDSKTVRI